MPRRALKRLSKARAAVARAKLSRAKRVLEKRYGPRPRPADTDGLDMLVRAMLSQNTNKANSTRGYAMLRRELPTWTKVMNAPVDQVQRQIAICGLARMRARRLQNLLRKIKSDLGKLSLDALRTMSLEEADAYLRSFHGIGPKTATVTLCFAFGRPVLPVDKGVLRVLHRLKILPRKAGDVQASALLSPVVPPPHHYPLHVLLYDHAKELCKPRNPKCKQCPALTMCPFGLRRLAHRPTEQDLPSVKKRKQIMARMISGGVPKRNAYEPDF